MSYSVSFLVCAFHTLVLFVVALVIKRQARSLYPPFPSFYPLTARRCVSTAARALNLHAVLEELRRIMPKDLPWPEGWPSDEQEERLWADQDGDGESKNLQGPTRSPTIPPGRSPDGADRNPYPVRTRTRDRGQQARAGMLVLAGRQGR